MSSYTRAIKNIKDRSVKREKTFEREARAAHVRKVARRRAIRKMVLENRKREAEHDKEINDNDVLKNIEALSEDTETRRMVKIILKEYHELALQAMISIQDLEKLKKRHGDEVLYLCDALENSQK